MGLADKTLSDRFTSVADEIRKPDRDSLLLVADIVAAGSLKTARYTVRNLSAGGMMAQGATQLFGGAKVSVTLRGIGTVAGSVAWAEKDRYGVAFDHPIDPLAARAPVPLESFVFDTLRLRPRPRR